MTKPNSVEISFKDKSKFEEIKNPISEKKYAGRYHYEDCPFPTVDQGVCNCPDGLKPTPNTKKQDWEIKFSDEFPWLLLPTNEVRQATQGEKKTLGGLALSQGYIVVTDSVIERIKELLTTQESQLREELTKKVLSNEKSKYYDTYTVTDVLKIIQKGG